MGKELIWFLVGFIAAILWEKYREWKNFINNSEWMHEELVKIKETLDKNYDKLPERIKEKVRSALNNEVPNLDDEDFEEMPNYSFAEPFKTSAWQTFIASGFAHKLRQEDYKLVKDAYEQIEGTNYLMQTSILLLASTSSPLLSDGMKIGIQKIIRTNHISPIILILPKIQLAIPILKYNKNSSLLKLLYDYTRDRILFVLQRLYVSK